MQLLSVLFHRKSCCFYNESHAYSQLQNIKIIMSNFTLRVHELVLCQMVMNKNLLFTKLDLLQNQITQWGKGIRHLDNSIISKASIDSKTSQPFIVQ